MSSTRVGGGWLGVALVASGLVVARVSAHGVESLPPNPAVVALVEAVSVDSLRASVETLAGFGTRHANSDTLSTTFGIGAARRWVFDRFSAIGGLDVAYVSFDSMLCARAGYHRNVVATLPGAGAVERAFLVSGHLDSRTVDVCDRFSPAPGADDDASGVALVLEAARLLAPVTTDATVGFVAMAAEEVGLAGSRVLARTLSDAGVRVDGMVTNDIVGSITGCADPACPPEEPVIVDSMSVRNFSRGPSTSPHRQLTRAMALAAMRYVPGFSVTLVPMEDRPGRGGDHMPFADRGYPAARFTEANEDGDGTGMNGHQHNGDDLVEHVDFGYVARVTAVNLAGFANLALAPESPAAPSLTPLGGEQLMVTWPSVVTAPDLAGYRIALRHAFGDSLMYFRIDDAGLDAGPVQTHLLDGVDETQAIYVSVSAYDADGNESIFSEEAFLAPLVAVSGADDAVDPYRLVVVGAPGASRVRVRFELPGPGHATLDLLEVSGRRVARLVDVRLGAGPHEERWEATAAPGVYLLQLAVDGRLVAGRKLTVLR